MRVFVVAMGDFQPTWGRVIGAFAIVSMLLGNLVAVQQSNIKRMLAYSSIAHAGYLMIGFVTFAMAPSGFDGLGAVLFYLLAYLFTNIGAFLAVIAVEQATGSTAIADYAGLWKRAPAVSALFAYLLLSLTGIPITGGMFAKLSVFGSAMQAGPFGYLLAGGRRGHQRGGGLLLPERGADDVLRAERRDGTPDRAPRGHRGSGAGRPGDPRCRRLPAALHRPRYELGAGVGDAALVAAWLSPRSTP